MGWGPSALSWLHREQAVGAEETNGHGVETEKKDGERPRGESRLWAVWQQPNPKAARSGAARVLMHQYCHFGEERSRPTSS